MFSQFDIDRVETLARDSEVRLWVEVFVVSEAGVFVLKVEVLRQICQDHLHRCLCERLPEADSPTSTEWDKAMRVPLLAGGSQRQRVVAIEALG